MGHLPTEEELDEVIENACSTGGVLNNISKSAFNLMSKVSNLAEVLKEFPAENSDELEAQCIDLGEDFGTFIRVALGFHQA